MTTTDLTDRDTSRPRGVRLGLVVLVFVALVGTAWFVGERQGWSQIGTGGMNAQLLPKVGEPAPELFTLYANGEPMLLSALKGQPVWINFWGSWCPPCRTEMPELQAAWETLEPQGVVMLGISMRESPEEAVAYADRAGATFPVLTDPTWAADTLEQSGDPVLAAIAQSTRSWQVINFPTHIFIDREGIVRAVVLAQMDYDTAVGYGAMILKTATVPDVNSTGAPTGDLPHQEAGLAPPDRRVSSRGRRSGGSAATIAEPNPTIPARVLGSQRPTLALSASAKATLATYMTSGNHIRSGLMVASRCQSTWLSAMNGRPVRAQPPKVLSGMPR
jgi:peroxiredoxin